VGAPNKGGTQNGDSKDEKKKPGSDVVHYKGNQYLHKNSIGYQLWKEKKVQELDKHLKTIKWL